MVWSSVYETGNKVIDDEHKEMFMLVKAVLDAAFESRKEKIDTSVKFLSDYVVRHFEHEEELADECGYPDASIHKKQHQDFLKTVATLKEKVAREGDVMDVSLAVNDTVVAWLTEHIMGSDKLLADYYKEWK